MGLLIYFGRPIAFILVCMILVRLFGTRQPQLARMTRSAGIWLGSWSVIGFAVATFLGVSAWIMNDDFIMSHADWVWPFSLGLMALQREPAPLDVLLVLAITAAENATLYFALAAMVGLAFYLVARVKEPRNRSLSILGR